MSVKVLFNTTNQGLDIILSLVPQAIVAVENPKVKFKYRPDEKTPSAKLVPPSEKFDYWSLVDYGISMTPMSPIKLYMREHNMIDSDYNVALHELAMKFGVEEVLKKDKNRPEWTKRPARDDDKKELWFKPGGEITPEQAKQWGPNVTVENLKELGWISVEYWHVVKDGEYKECHATANYPMFAQKCPYIDDNGDERVFYKIYEPFNYDKEFRFKVAGKTPKDYIFGLDALKKAFRKNGEKKIARVALVSGGSDGANCLSMGLQPVWLNSESADLSYAQLKEIKEYAQEVYSIPDIDSTGRRCGARLALRYPEIKTIWLDEELLGRFTDKRGKQRKDLKDYMALRPSPYDFYRLIDKALQAKFWYWTNTREGNKLQISLIRICYFLELNGYRILRDKHSDECQCVHIEGNVVEVVRVVDIRHFLQKWIRDNEPDTYLADKVLRSKDISKESIMGTLKEVELDFSSGTSSSQWFYFQNCAVEVTKDEIKTHSYQNLYNSNLYVFKHLIIPHCYTQHDPMFNITKRDDGGYDIDVHSTKSEMFCFLINASRNYWRKELEEQFGDDLEKALEYQAAHKFCINGEGLTLPEIQEQMQSLVNKIFVLGYLLHQYKAKSRAWAPVLYDYRIGNIDECNGRTGKSLFISLLETYISVLTLDGREIAKRSYVFPFSGMKPEHKLVFIDECPKGFYYEYFFSRITGDFIVEKKGIDQYTIPFADSSKLCFATNFVIPNKDSSSLARQLQVVFSDYYHQQAQNINYRENRSVSDDFGHDLGGAEYESWDADIAFLMQCEQFYLSTIAINEKILPPLDNIIKRQMKQVIGDSFESWADDYFQENSGHLDTAIEENTMYADCKNVAGKYIADLTSFRNKLADYIVYADHLDSYNPVDITGGKKDGLVWRKHEKSNLYVNYIYIRSTKAKLEAAKPTKPTVEEDIPFVPLADDNDLPY